jgi:hypothetical protein
MERMIAVAVRDRSHLFLWMRVRRAEGDIYYALPTGREEDPEWSGTRMEVGTETGASTTKASTENWLKASGSNRMLSSRVGISL